MKKALLVLDMQNAMVGQNHAKQFNYNNDILIQAVNEAIDANKGETVIYIKHVMRKNLINFFASFHTYEGTYEAEIVENLHVISDHVFTKYKGNAFTNPKLYEFLEKNGVECVEIVGVDGGWCVALTALEAANGGYHVIVNESAIGTIYHKRKEKYFKMLQEKGVQFT